MSSDLNLKCPLSGEYYEIPIAMPCCKKIVSRESMVDLSLCHWTDDELCPFCKSDIRSLDLFSIPIEVEIEVLVELKKYPMEETSQ